MSDPDTPIGQLVDGFAAIAGQPIPYAQLPPRLRLHADRYTHWYTLAHHTPNTLATQPKVGPSAVNAILAAARAAVATASAPPATTPAERAQRLLDQFDTNTRTLLTARVLALDPLPAADIAGTLHCCETNTSPTEATRACADAATQKSHPSRYTPHAGSTAQAPTKSGSPSPSPTTTTADQATTSPRPSPPHSAYAPANDAPTPARPDSGPSPSAGRTTRSTAPA